MDRFTTAQEQDRKVSQLTARGNAIYNGASLDHQQSLTTSNTANTTTTPPTMIPSPSNLSAVTATFNTAELLEQILGYLPAPQLLASKATCRTFCNAIEASPVLRRKTSTFLRLGEVVDDENDSFSTDAGGEVVFPTKGLKPLAFFYPGDGERRLFVRFEVRDAERFLLGGVGKARSFGELSVVDQALSDVRVGWHCGCFEEGRGEVEVLCGGERVSFGDVLVAIEGGHWGKGEGRCGSLSKFWLDGLWKRSGEVREFG